MSDQGKNLFVSSRGGQGTEASNPGSGTTTPEPPVQTPVDTPKGGGAATRVQAPPIPGPDGPNSRGAKTAEKPVPSVTPLEDVQKPQPLQRPGGPEQVQNQGSRKMGLGAGKGAPRVIEVRPMAQPARMQRRHWGLLFSLFLIVLLPLAAVGGYLWVVAQDRYGSTTGFTVRQEEGSSATDILGGLAQFTGASSSPDGDVLYEFIRSQEMVRRIDSRLDLRGHYSAHWSEDPVFSLWPDAPIEDLHWFWTRIVRVSYDQATGLTELEVIAFDPDMAQNIASEIVAESQRMVNALNEAAQEDAIRYAEDDLQLALERLKTARAALTEFRTRTQIVDLEADIQGRMGVMNTLQQQLAQELLDFDELSQSTRVNDPRLVQALRRIDVIRERIATERETFAATQVLETGEDYPTLIAEFERLTVDREFAEETYRAALAARDAARIDASRQSRYLAAYIEPTLAETSEFPQRITLFGLAAVFLTLGWSILALVYYSIRDRG